MGKIALSLMIFTMINLLALVFAPFMGVGTIGDFVMFKIFNQDEFETQSIRGLDSDFTEGFNEELTEETGVLGTSLSFVDGLKHVFSFIITLLTLGFAVFSMLLGMGAPFVVAAIIGLPTGLVFYLSIVSAMRGFDI